MGVQNVVNSAIPIGAMSVPVVSVISGARTWGSNDFQSRDDRSLSGHRTASGAQF